MMSLIDTSDQDVQHDHGRFYDPKSIQCRNVESTEDGTECILLTCKCLSSLKSGVVHTVFAVFEDKQNGSYLRGLSSCSCKKGSHFCSHSVGFLYLISTMQIKSETQELFERYYVSNPLLKEAALMPIECSVIFDKFQQQSAQSKRQSKRQRQDK